jgi:hypothetical protein
MTKYIVLFSLALFVGAFSLQAQQLSPGKGKVVVTKDPKLDQVAAKYKKMSANNPEQDGYRVQIFFDSGSNSKGKASSVKTNFESLYSGTKAYLSYKEPYYRIRVGNFRTLVEAVGFQKKIAADFPNAFPVKDKVVF